MFELCSTWNILYNVQKLKDMKTKLEKKIQLSINRIISDESFLTNISIKQTMILMDKIHEAKTINEIDKLIHNAEKQKL